MASNRNLTAPMISEVESELWNVIRAINLIETMAIEIAAQTSGEANAAAEGIAGVAVTIVSHIRLQQITLGGAE